MLTPREIREQRFVRAVIGGYDMASVDAFMARVEADFTALSEHNSALVRENAALQRDALLLRQTLDALTARPGLDDTAGVN